MDAKMVWKPKGGLKEVKNYDKLFKPGYKTG